MIDQPAEMIGRYRVIGQLASGSQGTVYHAYDPQLDREVAVKVLHPHLVSPDVISRFRREAQLIASISHPNIASIREVGEHRGSHFIAMEYVPHTTRELTDRGPMEVTRAVTIAYQTALALEAARTSSRGITHHDIKPENLLLTTLGVGGAVKLIDFGIAHAADMAPLTHAGSQWGTPYYMPPEQWMGERGDTRSDVYSLGVVLYQMLSGHVPFNSTASNSLVRQNEIARQHIQVNATSLHYLRQDVPMSVVAIVERCLAKEPGSRFQTPGELANALAGSIGLAPVQVLPEPTFQPDWQEPRGYVSDRQSRVPLIAVGGFVAMIVVASTLLMVCEAGGRAQRPAPMPMIEDISVMPLEVADASEHSAQPYSLIGSRVPSLLSLDEPDSSGMSFSSPRQFTAGSQSHSRSDVRPGEL